MDPTQNDSFGSFSNGQGGGMQAGGVSGVTTGGPIILDNGGVKSKKWVWVIVIVLVFVAVGGTVFAVWRGGVFGGKVNNTSDTDFRLAFNNYANYYLYGDAKDSDVENGTGVNESYFGKMVNSNRWDLDYIKKLEEYYEKFDTMFIDKWQNDTYGLSLVNEYSAKFWLIMSNYGGAIITQSDLLEAYLSGGEEQATTKLASVLAPYKELGDVYGMNYYEIAFEYGSLRIKSIAEYQKLGCINDDGIDYSCVSERNNNELQNMYQKMDTCFSDMAAILNNSERDLYYDIFRINIIIYGEDNEE